MELAELSCITVDQSIGVVGTVLRRAAQASQARREANSRVSDFISFDAACKVSMLARPSQKDQ